MITRIWKVLLTIEDNVWDANDIGDLWSEDEIRDILTTATHRVEIKQIALVHDGSIEE